MKLRHARSIAVFAVVLVALTGARRGSGDGGGCDDHSSSSDSSSSGSYSSGGSGSDYDDDSLTSGSSSSGSSSTGTTGGGTDQAINDIRITDCVIESLSDTTAEIKWKYEVTNSGVDPASYSGNFTFKDDAGTVVAETSFITGEVSPGTPHTDESTAFVSESDVTSGDLASLQGRCYVDEADKL
ncbi:hypothetical protein [Streptomyces sp. NPDC002851]